TVLKADFHIHTRFSMDSENTPEDIIARCQELGINCIAVSDHDAVEGALQIQKLAPFKVIVAEEVLTFSGEVMGMFLKERIASGIPLETAIDAIHGMGGLVAIPHPFDPLRGLRLSTEDFDRIAPKVDIVEVFNARCRVNRAATKAREYAGIHKLAMTGGSDAHTIREIGNVMVTLDDFRTPEEFLTSLGKATIEGKRASPFVHLNRTINKIKKAF
ncbi:MAG: PHP domain-containing protein, partial [Dehalococcoidales bacterium]|nr:PHP domain-containing protein [Dehalococcoidales bacterium]